MTIEKNEGCNHMTCRHCLHEFCWLCGNNWYSHGSCPLLNGNGQPERSVLDSPYWGPNRIVRGITKTVAATVALPFAAAGAVVGGVVFVGAVLPARGVRRLVHYITYVPPEPRLPFAERLTRGVHIPVPFNANSEEFRQVIQPFADEGAWIDHVFVVETMTSGSIPVVLRFIPENVNGRAAHIPRGDVVELGFLNGFPLERDAIVETTVSVIRRRS